VRAARRLCPYRTLTGLLESLTLVNLGHLELNCGNHDLALEWLNAAYDGATEIGNSPRIQLGADLELAGLNEALGRSDTSRLHLHRALELARTTGNVQRPGAGVAGLRGNRHAGQLRYRSALESPRPSPCSYSRRSPASRRHAD